MAQLADGIAIDEERPEAVVYETVAILVPVAKRNALAFQRRAAVRVPIVVDFAGRQSKWNCHRSPERHVLPADHPFASDRLIFCMTPPHSSDTRCASALAISNPLQYAVLI